TFVPHSSQNFAPGFSSCWQLAHFAGACELPHSLQNFEPAGMAAPHFTHFAVAAAAPEPPAANPAPPDGFCAASRIASAAWNCVYLFTSPITPIEVRLSIAASTSSGNEMFSTTNLVSSKPSDLNSSCSFCRAKPLSSS